jgi:hypothetical protein
MQVKNHKTLKMSFKDYYSGLDKVQSEIRDEIVEELGISLKTFYNKLNFDRWSTLERAAIDRIMQNHLERISQKQITNV